jgi:hypothetical protein
MAPTTATEACEKHFNSEGIVALAAMENLRTDPFVQHSSLRNDSMSLDRSTARPHVARDDGSHELLDLSVMFMENQSPHGHEGWHLFSRVHLQLDPQ